MVGVGYRLIRKTIHPAAQHSARGPSSSGNGRVAVGRPPKEREHPRVEHTRAWNGVLVRVSCLEKLSSRVLAREYAKSPSGINGEAEPEPIVSSRNDGLFGPSRYPTKRPDQVFLAREPTHIQKKASAE